MTTPGGVPNLPLGALTIDNLASKTQDMTPTAMRGRAAERMPSIFDTSSGGNALNDLTPFGILTQLFAGFNSVVANADPADVQGPADLPGLLIDFIESLPVIGELVGLLDAILGTYTGDDPVLLEVQTIFAPIRTLLQLITGISTGFPTSGQVTTGWGGILQPLIDAISTGLGGAGGLALPDITSLLGVIPGTNVLGIGGPATQDATHQSIWDNLWQGLTGSATGTGKSIADVNNAATTLSNQVAAIAAGMGSPIPVSTTFTGGSYTYNIPSWCNFIDVIELGGGGGGQGLGFFGSWGEGGHGGAWNSVTITYGTTFARTTTTITGTVGAGGTAGPGSGTTTGGTGGSTTAAATGWSGGLTAAGGAGGSLANLDTNGKSPGDTTFLGTTYTGGLAQATTAAAGNAPGGGGAGATITFQAGGAGAHGQIWFVARTT